MRMKANIFMSVTSLTGIFIPLDGQIFQGPVVQSIVSLTSSLRVISLTVLADSIYNILIFFAHIFSAKNFSIFAYHSIKILTNR